MLATFLFSLIYIYHYFFLLLLYNFNPLALTTSACQSFCITSLAEFFSLPGHIFEASFIYVYLSEASVSSCVYGILLLQPTRVCCNLFFLVQSFFGIIIVFYRNISITINSSCFPLFSRVFFQSPDVVAWLQQLSHSRRLASSSSASSSSLTTPCYGFQLRCYHHQPHLHLRHKPILVIFNVQ